MPEFFRFVINSIENELGPGNIILSQVFNGILCSTIICTECDSVSTKEEVFIDLQVELSESVEKSLESFTREEVLSTGYHCICCKRNTVAIKSLGISKVPNCLSIQIKRFKQQPNPHKSTSFIKYRRKMMVRSLRGTNQYELVSVGVHIGSMSSGHYITYGKRSRNWYCFDDSLCTKVDLKRVLNQTAYMLVYKLIV
jgi:ubiquitin C-terminal hydrolase